MTKYRLEFDAIFNKGECEYCPIAYNHYDVDPDGNMSVTICCPLGIEKCEECPLKEIEEND